jgi:hypothetical protein
MNTQALSFTLPAMSAVGPTTSVNRFKTARTGADRVSKSTTITAMHYDDKARAIRVFCADGATRTCLIDRMPSMEAGRQLWSALKGAGQEGSEVQFVAAGGFSPDRWFYDVI